MRTALPPPSSSLAVGLSTLYCPPSLTCKARPMHKLALEGPVRQRPQRQGGTTRVRCQTAPPCRHPGTGGCTSVRMRMSPGFCSAPFPPCRHPGSGADTPVPAHDPGFCFAPTPTAENTHVPEVEHMPLRRHRPVPPLRLPPPPSTAYTLVPEVAHFYLHMSPGFCSAPVLPPLQASRGGSGGDACTLSLRMSPCFLSAPSPHCGHPGSGAGTHVPAHGPQENPQVLLLQILMERSCFMLQPFPICVAWLANIQIR